MDEKSKKGLESSCKGKGVRCVLLQGDGELIVYNSPEKLLLASMDAQDPIVDDLKHAYLDNAG